MNLKKHNKLSIILVAFCCCSITLNAQITQELQLIGGGSYSRLLYSTNTGQATGGLGAVAGLGYSILFDDHFGLLTGVEFGVYNASYSADFLSSSVTGQTDANGLNYTFYSDVVDYRETHSASYLTIPIMAQFQTGATQRFFATAGIKVGIPVSAGYRASGIYTNKGHFMLYDDWAIDQEFMGFGTFSDKESREKTKFGLNMILSLEAGMRWHLTDRWSIYTSAFCDYGLIRINKSGPAPGFVVPDKESYHNFKQNSILNNLLPFSDDSAAKGQCKTFAIGLKVRIGIGL